MMYDSRASYSLYVVYFLNCKIQDNYGGWMKAQLGHVPADACLKIVAVSSDCRSEEAMYSIYQGMLRRRTGPTMLECHDEPDIETYEYHGIRAMWEIGQINPGRDDIVFYFHSKGLTHWDTWEEYEAHDIFHSRLGEKTIGQVDRVYEVFDLFPRVNKVGSKMSDGGFVWYNFMFARGSYLRRVEEPILTSRRYYYEDWICRVDLPTRGLHPGNATERRRKAIQLDDGYSLHADYVNSLPNMGVYFTPATQNDTSTWKRFGDKDWSLMSAGV